MTAPLPSLPLARSPLGQSPLARSPLGQSPLAWIAFVRQRPLASPATRGLS